MIANLISLKYLLRQSDFVILWYEFLDRSRARLRILAPGSTAIVSAHVDVLLHLCLSSDFCSHTARRVVCTSRGRRSRERRTLLWRPRRYFIRTSRCSSMRELCRAQHDVTRPSALVLDRWQQESLSGSGHWSYTGTHWDRISPSLWGICRVRYIGWYFLLPNWLRWWWYWLL